MLQLTIHSQILPSISTSKPLPPLPVTKSILKVSALPPQSPQLKIDSVQPGERCHLSHQEAVSFFARWTCCGLVTGVDQKNPVVAASPVWLCDPRVMKPSLTSKRKVCWWEWPRLQPASPAGRAWGHLRRPNPGDASAACSLQWVPDENHRAKTGPRLWPTESCWKFFNVIKNNNNYKAFCQSSPNLWSFFLILLLNFRHDSACFFSIYDSKHSLYSLWITSPHSLCLT